VIKVRCVGHIATSIGKDEVALDEGGLGAAELVEKVRRLSSEKNPGFTIYNTLVLVEDGEAFVAAGSSQRLDGSKSVVLIPFSHGG
jgi:molybdopterin converting factor small subunit